MRQFNSSAQYVLSIYLDVDNPLLRWFQNTSTSGSIMTWPMWMPRLESTRIGLKAGKFVNLLYVPLFNMFFQSIISLAMCHHIFCLQMVLSEETAPSWGELQSEQVKFSYSVIFLVCSLLLCFYLLSFCETFSFSQLSRPLHVEAECQTRGQGDV